jgi:hypothetical protein
MLNALLAMAIIPVGVLCYLLFQAQMWGSPLRFLSSAIAWDRLPIFPGGGIVLALWYLLTFAVPLYSLQNSLPDLLFTLLPMIVLILEWRRLPLHYTLFSLAMLLFSLSTMVGQPNPNPLMSIPRYLMTIFPIFMIYGLEYKKHLRLRGIVRIVFPLLLIANMAFFVVGRWVA